MLQKINLLTFVTMGKLRSFFRNWREQLKFAVYDPSNFDELWGFTTTKIRLFSLLLIVVFIFGIGFSLLILNTPLVNYFASERASVDKNKLIEQKIQIDSLSSKVNAQEKYLSNITTILLGNEIEDTIKKINQVPQINANEIDPSVSKAENQLAKKVKDNQRTIHRKENQGIVHFISPVRGIVSQKFDPQNHFGIDVVTPADKAILACLSGTVIYSSYSQKDGHILIIEHANNFISVYKHAKSRFKKAGDKVRTGDPIAIVGNTGENSSGPHLHFELWLNQKPVNPSDYINFKK